MGPDSCRPGYPPESHKGTITLLVIIAYSVVHDAKDKSAETTAQKLLKSFQEYGVP